MRMTRQEHMDYCKERALKELSHSGDLANALASMASDLEKHTETKNHSAIQLGLMMLMAGQLKTSDEMRKFILGFN